MEQKLIVELELNGQKILAENIKNLDLKIGDKIIAFIDGQYEVATVVSEEKIINKPEQKVHKIIRKVSQQDLQHILENERKNKEAMKIIKEKIRNYRLPAKIVNVRYTFDRSKLFVYYTADSYVNFKPFVREIAYKLKTRVEMKQLGPRDETKIVGGIGVCGYELCCKRWIRKFESISVEMAKTQQLVLNIPKLSGLCNRLKCCLYYEYDFYKEACKRMPKIGAKVYTPDGSEAKVISINCIKQTVTVEIPIGDTTETITKTFNLDQIKFSLIEKIKQGLGLEK